MEYLGAAAVFGDHARKIPVLSNKSEGKRRPRHSSNVEFDFGFGGRMSRSSYDVSRGRHLAS